MEHRNEEDEEVLRAYAEVFARLDPDAANLKPTLRDKISAESRRRMAMLRERVDSARDELSDRARDAGAVLTPRLHEARTELTQRARGVAERVMTRAREIRSWRRAPADPTAPRRPIPVPREPSIFVGLASFAFAFTVAWWTGGPTDDVPERKPTFLAEQAVPAVVVPTPAARPAAFDVGQVLRTPGVSEAAQLAVVDELSKDPGVDATKALLAGVDSDSLYVSMACLKALAGRPCDAIAADLARRLDDPSWQRRAWAARILGANSCGGAGRQLTQRLAVESDDRVQAQLQLSIDSLKEPGA